MVNYSLCRAIDLILDLADGRIDGNILKIEEGKRHLKKFIYDIIKYFQ